MKIKTFLRKVVRLAPARTLALSSLQIMILFQSCDINLQEQTTTLIQEEAVRVTKDGWLKRSPTWSPDGTMIAYASEKRVDKLTQVTALSGVKEVLSTLPREQNISPLSVLSFSPDWTRVAYRSESNNRIWIRDLLTHTEQVLTLSNQNAYHPAWSNDGKWIAYRVRETSSLGHIWYISADGGEPVQLTFGETSDSFPSWSPDGLNLVYESSFLQIVANRSVVRFVSRVVAVAGGDFRQLLPDSVVSRSPNWSPDGAKIAFWAVINRTWGVWTIAATGGEPNLVTASFLSAHAVAWSPDGNKIAYAVGGTINIIDSNGEGPVSSVRFANIVYPNWYKDKESFIVGEQVGFTEIESISLVDSAVAPITHPDDFEFDDDPVWTREGIIYFTRSYFTRSSSIRQIWTVDVAAQEELLLVNDVPSEFRVLNGTVSSDGKRFLFDNGRDVFLGFPESGKIVNLTEEIGSFVFDPSFSPSGDEFVAISNRDIVLYQIEGSEAMEKQKLSRVFRSPRTVTWSPEAPGTGSHIAVESGGIYLLSLDNPGPTLVAFGFDPAWSPDGTRLAYVRSDREIYVFKPVVNLE